MPAATIQAFPVQLPEVSIREERFAYTAVRLLAYLELISKIETLQIDHSKKLRAEVTLSGGEYKIITLHAFPGSNDDLLDEEQRYAIEDTLAGWLCLLFSWY